MKAFYTKRSFKLDDKIKRYWEKVGYICNHLYRPMVVLTEFSEYYKKNMDNYMIGVYDIDSINLFHSLKSFNLKGIIY